MTGVSSAPEGDVCDVRRRVNGLDAVLGAANVGQHLTCKSQEHKNVSAISVSYLIISLFFKNNIVHLSSVE